MHLFLPIRSMFEHRVENRQEFAHTSDQRHLAFFAARAQGLVCVPNDRITAGRHQGRHAQNRAHGRAAAHAVGVHPAGAGRGGGTRAANFRYKEGRERSESVGLASRNPTCSGLVKQRRGQVTLR